MQGKARERQRRNRIEGRREGNKGREQKEARGREAKGRREEKGSEEKGSTRRGSNRLQKRDQKQMSKFCLGFEFFSYTFLFRLLAIERSTCLF